MTRIARVMMAFASLGLALLVVGCSLAVLPGNAGPAVPTVQLAVARRSSGLGALSFSGNIRAVQQVTVVPAVAGRVTRVLVDVGSEVQAGDELLDLDTDTLAAQVAQAEAALAAAQARLDAMRAGPRAEVVTQAEVALSMARSKFSALERGGRAEVIAQAEAGLAAAQADLARVVKGAGEQDIALANLAIDQAKNALWGVQANRDGVCGNKGSPGSACHAAEAQVAAAETAVQQAQTRLAQLQAGATPETVQQAEAAVRASQEQLKLARQPASEDDLAQARDAVRLAEAQLALARQPFTAYDLAATEAAVAQARAAADLAGLAMAEATVRAPMDGLVAQRLVSKGSMAGPATPLLVLISPETEAVMNVDEAAISILRVGLGGTLTTDACPGVRFAARVAAIAPSVDSRSRTVQVRLSPDDPGRKLRDGMLVQVAITPDGAAGALMVPANAVVQGDGGPVVYTVRGGKAERRSVLTGAADGAEVAVTAGLSEGERVITDPSGLVDGQIVIVP